LTETGSALDDSQLFVARAGSAAGAALLHHLEFPEPPASLLNEAEARVRETAARLSRGLPSGTADILRDNRESPYWEEVAGRCLGCANCTLACPTCFCSTTREVTDLGGEVSDHHRTWESCFTMAFSEVHGGIIRGSLAASYRQWLTHKLADWWDQFGSSGCVGCGRCITWCPVGIDLTAEVRALSDKAAGDSR
ncbi:MAG: 4Fe-4S dicluster domain-containing protein, partial [Magnetovibrionaceae bacterium]